MLSLTILFFLVFYFGSPWIIAERRNCLQKKQIKTLSILLPVIGLLGGMIFEPIWGAILICGPPSLILWALINKKDVPTSDVHIAKTPDKEKPLDEIELPANSYVCSDCNFVIEKSKFKEANLFCPECDSLLKET